MNKVILGNYQKFPFQSFFPNTSEIVARNIHSLYLKNIYEQHYNIRHNILELYNVLIQTRLTASKTKHDIQYSKLGIQVASRVAKRLKNWDRILGNKEILGKSQIWAVTQPSAQSPFHKLNFGSSSKKTRKSRYQTFVVLFSFTGFLYFVPNVLLRMISPNKVLVLTWPSLLQTLIFRHFLYYKSISPIFKENIKQVSCVKIPNFTVFCKKYFACSVQIKN